VVKTMTRQDNDTQEADRVQMNVNYSEAGVVSTIAKFIENARVETEELGGCERVFVHLPGAAPPGYENIRLILDEEQAQSLSTALQSAATGIRDGSE